MPLEQKHPLHSLKTDIQKNLLNDIGSQGLQNLIDTSLCVNIQIDGLGQIQAENTPITYLPDTRSKSTSNLVRSFTKDFTLSMEFKEIRTVFMYKTSLMVFSIFL